LWPPATQAFECYGVCNILGGFAIWTTILQNNAYATSEDVCKTGYKNCDSLENVGSQFGKFSQFNYMGIFFFALSKNYS
jgi:hypothetical protein